MLEIEGLTHTYPNGTRALKHIDLKIGKGIFGLLGANGAGKSSLIRTIATLQQPSGGSVRFGDIDVIRQPDALRRVLGYLPQDFGVYPRGSAYAILDHLAVLKGLRHARERKRVVERLLVETNLHAVRHKRLATFSGGMRQRFGIAQALLGEPKLIIVDEPTAGLDPEERNRFHNLLAEISKDVVVILSTHLIEDVTNLCADMAVLAEGRLLLRGKPAELIQKMEGRIWTKGIESSQLPGYEQDHHVISNHLRGGRTRIRIFAASNPGDGFEPVEANLSDVYFSAVKGEQANRQRTA
ncbi:MAG: ABC transporter ATP-binding protein [Acidobacteriota bacterium]|nr:ABC transporter ATP-binding protein [Acidobacteriota bacterium]